MATSIFNPTVSSLFQTTLPTAERVELDGTKTVTIDMQETEQWVGLYDANGNKLMTKVFGYGVVDAQGVTHVSWPGPTLVAHAGVPVKIDWENHLPETGALVPIDASILGAHTMNGMTMSSVPPYHGGTATHPGYSIGTVVHLHGGHTDSASDGNPMGWFSQGNDHLGPEFAQTAGNVYTYDNSQRGGTLWYHDHTMGITRANVYSGLAGFYLLRDDVEKGLIDNKVIPTGTHELELAIQDRAFKTDGQLYLPAMQDDPLPGTTGTVNDVLPPDYVANGGKFPTAVPEFFGNVMMVNGMAWPTTTVDASQYRLHLLNGSDSRVEILRFSDPNVKVTLIGTDGGLLNKAITIVNGDGIDQPEEQIVLGPGERADVVVDFSGCAGKQVTMLNVGPDFEPFKGLNPDGTLAGGLTALTANDPMGNVMRFDVSSAPAPVTATVTDGTVLDPTFEPLHAENAVRTRQLGLYEVADNLGRTMPMLGVAQTETDSMGNKVNLGPLAFSDPVTERPQLGTSEIWEIYNTTADSHPVHLHLTEFAVVERRKIIFTDANGDGLPDDINGDGKVTTGVAGRDDMYVGDIVPLRPEDMGAQDTVLVAPGEMLKIVALFDKPGDYMWHCHILSHEDHDMMRTFTVVDEWANKTVVDGHGAVNDALLGTAGADVLNGFGGNDTLTGGAGADILNGGEGIDIASYLKSADGTVNKVGVVANLDDSTLNTGDAAGDTYNGIEGLEGSDGADTLTGDRYDNQLIGNGGNDTLNGAGGDDTLTGGAGDDVLNGGAGDDTFIGVDGSDTIIGDLGTDKLVIAASSKTWWVSPSADPQKIILSDGTNSVTLSSVEKIVFTDGTYVLGADMNYHLDPVGAVDVMLNHRPVAVADVLAVNEDAAVVTGSVATNDKDADAGDVLTYSLDAPIAGLTLNADGTYRFDPGNAAYQSLAAGQKLDIVAAYTVKDQAKAPDHSTLTITVTGVNDAAVVGNLPNVHLYEDACLGKATKLTAAGKLTVTDVDAGQSSFQTAVQPANGTLGALTLAADGSYGYAVDNAAVQFLAAGQTKVDSFTVKTFDGTEKVLNFTLHGRNDAAIIGLPPVHDVTEDVGVSATGKLTAAGVLSITDVDQGQASFLTTVSGARSNLGTLTLAADGHYTYAVDNQAVQVLRDKDTRVDTFTVTALDGTKKTISFAIHGADEPVGPREVLYHNEPGRTQWLNGTSNNDVFVVHGNSNDYNAGPTQDGKGIVVWNGRNFDILKGFEVLRFDDKDVKANASGQFDIHGQTAGNGEKLYQNVAGVQHLTGTTAHDVFVMGAKEAGYHYNKTQDGTGIVVWKGSDFDILHGFETIRFTDHDVQIASII